MLIHQEKRTDIDVIIVGMVAYGTIQNDMFNGRDR